MRLILLTLIGAGCGASSAPLAGPAGPPPPPLLGEWRGEFHQFSYGLDTRSPLVLRVTALHEGHLRGTLHWPTAGDAVTTVRGRIGGAAVSFTETGYVYGRDLVLNGRYVGQLSNGRTLRGEWFDPKTGAEGGRFVLHRRPGTSFGEDPDTLIARGAIAAPGVLLERLEKAARRFGSNLPPMAPTGPAMLEWVLGFGGGMLDLGRPLHVALFTPRPYDQLPLAVIVATKDPEALVATLPAAARPAAGNAWSFQTGPPLRARIYVNLLGDRAVITGDARLFPRHRAFFERLAREAPRDDVSLRVALSSVVPAGEAGQEAEIAAASAAVAESATIRAGEPVPPAAARPYVAWAMEVVRQCEVLELAADVRDDGVLLRARLPAIEGTALAEALATVPRAPAPTVFDQLPVDSLLAGFFTLRGPATEGLLEAIATSTARLRFPDDAERAERMRAEMRAHWEALGASHAFAMHAPPESQRLTLVELHEVRDATAARETRRRVAWLQADPTAAYPDWATSPAVRFDTAVYKVGAVPVDVLRLTGYTARRRGPLDHTLDAMLGTVHMAYAPHRAVLAYGADARSDIERFLAKDPAPGLASRDDVRRALRNAVSRPLFFAVADPLPLLARAGPAGGGAYGLITGPHATALAVSGGVEDGALALVFDLPFEPFVQLARLRHSLDL